MNHGFLPAHRAVLAAVAAGVSTAVESGILSPYVFGERGAGVRACGFWRRLGATIATTGSSETLPKPAAGTATLPKAKHIPCRPNFADKLRLRWTRHDVAAGRDAAALRPARTPAAAVNHRAHMLSVS
ncbi:MAG: hypothetical protein HY735_24995 [Verrucomicrobia bacterium]|nr:hypothetical protein [Verrucomicrobiota bacterium]